MTYHDPEVYGVIAIILSVLLLFVCGAIIKSCNERAEKRRLNNILNDMRLTDEEVYNV